jgi:hypothetical protein
MKKYIKCEHCGKKVYFGDYITTGETEDSVAYCSDTCLVNSYGGRFILDETQANYWGFKVYDDSKRKREIEEKIAKLQKELETLNSTK